MWFIPSLQLACSHSSLDPRCMDYNTSKKFEILIRGSDSCLKPSIRTSISTVATHLRYKHIQFQIHYHTTRKTHSEKVEQSMSNSATPLIHFLIMKLFFTLVQCLKLHINTYEIISWYCKTFKNSSFFLVSSVRSHVKSFSDNPLIWLVVLLSLAYWTSSWKYVGVEGKECFLGLCSYCDGNWNKCIKFYNFCKKSFTFAS
jgi:hypothetical protein